MSNAVNKAEVALIAAEFGAERRGEVTGEVEGGGQEVTGQRLRTWHNTFTLSCAMLVQVLCDFERQAATAGSQSRPKNRTFDDGSAWCCRTTVLQLPTAKTRLSRRCANSVGVLR